MPAASIFSIPPTAPFLEKLINSLLAGELIVDFPDASDPLSLARATIYLPTRRACRELSDCFRVRNIVPHPVLRALGDFDESETLFTDESDDFSAPDLPLAIAPLERQVILTRLIMQWVSSEQNAGKPALTPSSPSDAFRLAGELTRLLDMLANEGLGIAALQKLPPLELQQHWESAYEFLKIAGDIWPAYLQAAKQMEPAQRRRALMQAEAARLLENSDYPVIAAGSTGSVPVTAEFLAAIARHPKGALVLPGLDCDLDEESWQLISNGAEPSHPQTALAALLQRLKITRAEVKALDGDSLLRQREHLISEIMRPASTSDAWAKGVPDQQSEVENIALLEAAHEHEEALAIACLMRETLEIEQASAALVTPDRRLARQVAVELKRFGLQVDDSAGTPLNVTQAGVFARLVAEAALHSYESAGTLSLLQHPLCALKTLREGINEANGAIERVLFRGFSSGRDYETLLRQFELPQKTESTRRLKAQDREKGRSVSRNCTKA